MIYMILGVSNSGKSVEAARLLSQVTKPKRVVNDGNKSAPEDCVAVEWKDIKGLKDCALLVEDVIHLKRWQRDLLKSLLMEDQHHR